MGLWNKIKSWFGMAKAKVAPVLVSIFGQEAADHLGQAVLLGLESSLGKIALSAVTAVNSLKVNGVPATGDQKRSVAFNNLLNTAKTEGMSVSTSTLNLLIEMAVQRLTNVIPVPKA